MKNQTARVSVLLLAGVAVAAAQTMTAPVVPASIVAAAKKDAGLNTIALPPSWANYGEIMDTFMKTYGLKITNASPDASSAEELQAIRSLKGQKRAPDVVDVGPAFAISGTAEKLFVAYKPATWPAFRRARKTPAATGSATTSV